MSKQQKYWVTTDTHFGHYKLMEYSGRPDDFEDRIFKGLGVVKENDILIHLGDICIGNDKFWHERMDEIVPHTRKWLLLGNHDRQSKTWYLSHGWDFVATSIELDIFGKKVVLSHRPVKDYGFDLNIHGHSHNTPDRYKDEHGELSNKHKLIYLEHHYNPFDLKKLC